LYIKAARWLLTYYFQFSIRNIYWWLRSTFFFSIFDQRRFYSTYLYPQIIEFLKLKLKNVKDLVCTCCMQISQRNDFYLQRYLYCMYGAKTKIYSTQKQSATSRGIKSWFARGSVIPFLEGISTICT
jgi:hypothetical protein